MNKKICNSEQKENVSFLAPEHDYNYDTSLTNKPLLSVNQNDHNKLVIRIWSEGFDGYSINLYNQKLEVNLHFIANNPNNN